MPHDCKNQLIEVGDTVLVRCVVQEVSPAPEFCNVKVETVLPMFPTQRKEVFWLNSAQVEKVQVPG